MFCCANPKGSLLCAAQVEVDRAVTDVVTFNARVNVKRERPFMSFSIPDACDRPPTSIFLQLYCVLFFRSLDGRRKIRASAAWVGTRTLDRMFGCLDTMMSVRHPAFASTHAPASLPVPSLTLMTAHTGGACRSRFPHSCKSFRLIRYFFYKEKSPLNRTGDIDYM